MDKIVYIVKYHSNAWADQEAPDHILGIFSNKEKAVDAQKRLKDRLVYPDDDYVDMYEIKLDEEDWDGLKYYGSLN